MHTKVKCFTVNHAPVVWKNNDTTEQITVLVYLNLYVTFDFHGELPKPLSVEAVPEHPIAHLVLPLISS